MTKSLIKPKPKEDDTEYVWCIPYDYWSAVRACRANCWRYKTCPVFKPKKERGAK